MFNKRIFSEYDSTQAGICRGYITNGIILKNTNKKKERKKERKEAEDEHY